MTAFEGVRERVAGAVAVRRLAREKGLPFRDALIVGVACLHEGAAGFSIIEMDPVDRASGRGGPGSQGTTTPPATSPPHRGP